MSFAKEHKTFLEHTDINTYGFVTLNNYNI